MTTAIDTIKCSFATNIQPTEMLLASVKPIKDDNISAIVGFGYIVIRAVVVIGK